MELQLSIVSDLPLIIGIWSIANLNNLKYGKSLNKLIQRTNEILEMMKFIEVGNRTKWLNDFITSSGGDKLDFLKLNDSEKDNFINGNLNSFRLISTEQQQQDLISQQENKVVHDNNGYLSPINKLLHNINNFPIPSRNIISESSRYHNQIQQHQQQLLNQSEQEREREREREHNQQQQQQQLKKELKLFNDMSKNLTINDINKYINNLKTAGIDSKIIEQLEIFLNEFGNHSTILTATPSVVKNEDGEDVIVKGGNITGLGSFDSSDSSFMKLYKKFIKSFEIDGVLININLKNDNDEDHSNVSNDELIKGYERRIKKLENLLHQQNFKQFNEQWSHHHNHNRGPPPVTSSSAIDESTSPNSNGENTILFNNDVGLGRKTIDLPPSHQSEKINKLQIENERMFKELETFKSNPLFEESKELKKQIAILKKDNEHLKNSNTSKDLKIKELEEKLINANDLNNELNSRNGKLEVQNTELKNMKSDLLENMSQKENDFTKESKINQQELNELKLKIEELEEDENNLITLNKSLSERTLVKDQLLCKLYELIQTLYTKLNQLSTEIFNNLTRVCLLLESIGLLLIRETPSFDNHPGKLTIKRVKGLRSRKKQIKQSTEANNGNTSTSLLNNNTPDITMDDTDQIENAMMEVVSSEIVPEAEQYLHWVDMNVLNYTLSSDLGIEEEIIQSKNTISNDKDLAEQCEESSIEKKIVKLLSNYQKLNLDLGYENFLKFNHVDSELVVDRVFRRFNDVETLARKLQKDKNQQKIELKTLSNELQFKISIKNFTSGDLVLFLKTLDPITSSNDVSTNIQNDSKLLNSGNSGNSGNSKSNLDNQPWAAFNIGSPNYYLKNLKFNGKLQNENYIDLQNRDWFVGRIINIESKLVTDENYNDINENPFKLSKSLIWYFVEAKEEKFGE
ncbi:hypothetical protein CANARDRAFT_175383 [[Candida] arabinofermentans NRRL YB-2248]|uniref:Autophagy-related protein 11 n=1 Tax=[Candida] arabinofermentans NRRL YB-2248 TaxID=983967 RepID=A0A1E4T4B9_9ASCO|nr:hypothetical protein CANARDRAFT_175383 [[Candida] arabinofermentans NRRL YB-2248]